MQNLMGRIRRCAEDYNMICEGDKIAVGVSGGKDSLSLLYLLAALRRYYPVHYDLQAVTIDMGLPGMDYSPVAELCAKLDVPYQIKKTEIGPIIFDYRHEKKPLFDVRENAPRCAERRAAGTGLQQDRARSPF